MSAETGYPIGRELRTMFPEQTRSIPALLIWTVIYLLDVAFVIWLCFRLGIRLTEMSMKTQSVAIVACLVAALGLFKVETLVYNKIVSLFR